MSDYIITNELCNFPGFYGTLGHVAEVRCLGEIAIHFDGRQNDKFRGKRNLRKTAYSFTLHCKDSMSHLSSQVTAEGITSTLLTAAGAELEAPDSDMPLYISKVP